MMKHRPWAGLAVAFIGLVLFGPLALLSKENAVLIAPVLLLLEAFVLKPWSSNPLQRRLIAGLLLTFVALPVGVGLFVLLNSHNELFAGYAGRDFNLGQRLLTEIHAICLYIQMILLPVPAQMTLFQDGFPIQRALDAKTFIAGTALLALVLGALLLRQRAPLIGFGVLWFFTWHLVESTALPLEPVFEHRNYLALMGMALVQVATLRPLITTQRYRNVLGIAVIGFLLLLGANTAARALQWRDAQTMMVADYAQHPNSPRLVEGMFGIAVAQANGEAALFFAQEQQRLKPTDAYGFLQELYLYCHSPRLPDGLVDQARILAKHGTVSPATTNGPQRLNEAVANGDCPAVPSRAMLTFAEGLAHNPNIHMTGVHLAALTTWALIAIQNGERVVAETALRAAILRAAEDSPGRLSDVLQAARVVAEHLPLAEEAEAFLTRLQPAAGSL
ncbi:hypothetical protein [Thiohalocapsa sp. ML1]|uniref:hypothetical protein n=1 Tax=Thiohalocapsa sp. ML1 TaxID=1431688 RepID=UPI000AF5CF49|nr:hypothetical protein [Thiohalocapsa sp. ML1]